MHDIGREMCPDNEACTPTLLVKICERIANLIIEKSKEANKILFLDTDVNITRSYGRFLLNIDIEVPQWIEDVNKSDLYIYLDTDCDLVQDGGRLATQELRNVLASSHKKVLGEKGINYYILNGSREDRFIGSIKLVDKLLS